MRRVTFWMTVLPVVLSFGACNKAANPFDDTDATDTDLWPADAADYKLHNGTFVADFQFPDVTTGDLCCRDFGDISRDFIKKGTNNGDNALAAMDVVLSAASKGKVDLRGPIMNSIRAGRFVPLFDHLGIPSADGDYKLAYFGGSPAEGTTFDTAKTGGGEFLLKPEYFEADAGKPAYLFGKAIVEDGKLTATDGRFQLPLPVLWGRVLLDVQRVQVTADVEIVEGGVTMSNGELSGYIKVDDWFRGYNEVVADKCACAGVSEVYSRGAGGWEANCLTAAQGSCTGTEAVTCGVLLLEDIKEGGICKAMFNGVAAAADLNFDDDDQTYEALSVGLRFSGVTAESTGLFSGDTGTP